MTTTALERLIADYIEADDHKAADDHHNADALIAAARAEQAELVAALQTIAQGMGNLPLDQMGPAGVHGINDGKQRAIYLEHYVGLARDLLAKF